MRTAYRVWSGAAVGVVLLAALAYLLTGSGAGPTGPAVPVAAPVPTAAASPPDEEPDEVDDLTLATVTRVVDGETVEVSGGRTIRLPGIDACPLDTRGGRDARAYVETFAGAGQRVRLVADGARDADDDGRLLRRVVVAPNYVAGDAYHNDLGVTVVNHEAIGVAAGGGDADPGYLAKLRTKDYGKRVCT